MQELLRNFESTLANRNPPLNPRFNPPTTEAQVKNAERSLAVRFPTDLKDFLLAANGQTKDCRSDGDVVIPRLRFAKGNDHLTAEGWFADLDTIVEQTLFDRVNRYSTTALPKSKRWGPVKSHAGLVNITVAETPWWLAIDFDPGPGGHIGQIVSVNEFPDQTVCIASSLSDFIRKLVGGFSKDCFEIDVQGYLSER